MNSPDTLDFTRLPQKHKLTSYIEGSTATGKSELSICT